MSHHHRVTKLNTLCQHVWVIKYRCWDMIPMEHLSKPDKCSLPPVFDEEGHSLGDSILLGDVEVMR
jgi:hypothetical protein